MKEKTRNTIIYIGILVVINAIGLGTGKLIVVSQERIYDFGYEAGWEDGMRNAENNYKTGVADGRYECKDKYGFMPQDACNENDRCKWLSKNQWEGDYYDCLNWFLEETYKKANNL